MALGKVNAETRPGEGRIVLELDPFACRQIRLLTEIALVESNLTGRGKGFEAFEPCHGLSLSCAIVWADDALVRPVAQSIRENIERWPRRWGRSDRQSSRRVLGGGQSIENLGSRHDEKLAWMSKIRESVEGYIAESSFVRHRTIVKLISKLS